MKPHSFAKIEERKLHGGFRSLSHWQDQIDFFSNDYLGIGRSLSERRISAGGSTGSRLISGNSIEAESCEIFLATFFGSEAALVFNSGYDANLGLFSSIARREDTILYDEFIHASIRDGIRLSHAKSYSFKHNNLEDLKQKLQFATGDVFVAIESLYSMDGDFAPIAEIAALCRDHQLYLIIDEAHSGGIFGPQGRGLTADLALESVVFARVITFGKAYGTHGAVVLGTEELKTYLINFARSFIYTTALPKEQYSSIQEAVNLAAQNDSRIQLQENIALFRSLMGTKLNPQSEKSPIQIIPFGKQETCLKAASLLWESGYAVKAILSPTVPRGKECLRICIHSFNSAEELKNLAALLKQF